MSTSALFPLQLETERLILFTAKASEIEAILTYLHTNKNFFTPWMPSVSATFYTETEQLRWIEHDRRLYNARSKLKLYFALKTAPDIIIGDLVFSNIIFGSFLSCYLGYKQAELFNGNGYMKEAIEIAIPYMFDVWGLHRIEANIVPRNERSLKLIKSLDFEEEGLSPKYLKINGVWEDHIHFVRRNPALE